MCDVCKNGLSYRQQCREYGGKQMTFFNHAFVAVLCSGIFFALGIICYKIVKTFEDEEQEK
jgi:hypothetical protein